MGEYDLAIAIGTILSGLAGISIATWAIISARSAKSQADSSKIQAESTLTQVKLEHEKFDQKMRPWIGILRFQKDGTGKIGFQYTNHGQIPPKKMQIKILTSKGEITQEILERTGTEVSPYIGIVFPKQEKFFLTEILLDVIKRVDENKEKIFIGILIEYNYSGESMGKMGTIVEYQGNGSFTISKEFVS